MPRPPFLKKEELPNGAAETGLFAVRTVHAAESPVYLVGGKRLDREFLANLPALGGTQLLLYRNLAPVFDPRDLVGAGGDPPEAARYAGIMMQARTTGRETNAIVYLTSARQDSVYATAIPLLADDGSISLAHSSGVSPAPLSETLIWTKFSLRPPHIVTAPPVGIASIARCELQSTNSPRSRAGGRLARAGPEARPRTEEPAFSRGTCLSPVSEI